MDYKPARKGKNYSAISVMRLNVKSLPLVIDESYVNDGELECIIFWRPPKQEKKYALYGGVFPLADGVPDFDNTFGFAFLYKAENRDYGFVSVGDEPLLNFALWKDTGGFYTGGTVDMRLSKPPEKKPQKTQQKKKRSSFKVESPSEDQYDF
jgi:hypothetical protein